MTKDEALALAAQHNAEHPDRETHQWRARPDGEDWSVVKIGLPRPRPEEMQAEQRADERPPSSDDPRPAHDRNVGGPWIGGA
jgi:hypothetical protein